MPASYGGASGGSSGPTTPAGALLDAVNPLALVSLDGNGAGTTTPFADATETGTLSLLSTLASGTPAAGSYLTADGADGLALSSAAPSAPREGSLLMRGAASTYPGGIYLVTVGTDSLWTLWQSVLVSGTWTWVRRPYQIPSDTITTTGMLADWSFAALTTSSTTATNAITPGTGDLAIASTMRTRLWQGITDASWPWWGLQSLPVSAGGEEISTTAFDLNAAGTLFEPTGDWTLSVWAARSMNGFTSPPYEMYAVLKRRDDANWVAPYSFSSIAIGLTTQLRATGLVAQGATPTFTYVTSADALPVGRLTLLTLVYVASSGTLTLYQDNRAVATTTGLGAISWGSGTSRSWCVGGNMNSSGVAYRQAWPGWIGRVMFSNTAATADDLARHIARVSGRTS